MSAKISEFECNLHTIPGTPDFNNLPWEKPLEQWQDGVPGLEQIQHGVSRHPLVFINVSGVLFVLKEMPETVAVNEYELLVRMNEARLPSVTPVGYARVRRNSLQSSILITRFLETSLPYRLLFISKAMDQYQNHLLDAIAGLLVQIHLNGFYWGDCSLSNILFRRDAGSLQAYLVDAETAEHHLPPLSPMLRYHDLEIMQENIDGELSDLRTDKKTSISFPLQETGAYIQQSYRNLWEEVTREEIFSPTELFRVEERIRALNSLGFSVKDIEIKNEEHGNILKLRIFVSDRNFHRDQLIQITGLYAEEHQAQQIMNEILELKANLSHTGYPNISMEAVAYHWIEHIYNPVAQKLQTLLNGKSQLGPNNVIELYCQVLEHKWYLSERANHDVGHQAAVDDYIHQFS